MLLCGNGGVVWAEQRIASGLAALLVAVEPLFIVLLAATLPQERRRPSGRALVGVAFGVAGVVLLVGPVATSGARASISPAPRPSSSRRSRGRSARSSPATSRRRRRPCRRPPSRCSREASSSEASPASWESGPGSRPRSCRRNPLASVAYLVVFGSLVAFTAYIWLLRAASPALVSTYAFVNPVVAVFLGWLLAAESAARTLVAAAVIVGAVVLITLGESRE